VTRYCFSSWFLNFCSLLYAVFLLKFRLRPKTLNLDCRMRRRFDHKVRGALCSPAARGLILLKSAGVKVKVFVKDDDGIWSGDDDVDGFVQRLRLTPARSASTSSWTRITMRGLRSSHKTTSVTFSFLPNLSVVCALQVTVCNSAPAVNGYIASSHVLNC